MSEALKLAEVFETFAIDHKPDGWPAIQQHFLSSAAKELRRLARENAKQQEALRVALDALKSAGGCLDAGTLNTLRQVESAIDKIKEVLK